MTKYSVIFEGNDISQVIGVDLFNHNFTNLPDREIKINKVARRDLSIITSSEYSKKEITVNLEACTGTRSDTEDTMTFLKSLLQAQNGTLSVLEGGTEVDYTATMNEFNIEWNGPLAVVTIIFVASDPIGRETTSQTMLAVTGITSASSSYSTLIQGSSTAYPLITLSISALTGGTAKQITIANGKTNQGITITRTWTAGDILVIDSDNMQVTVNGTLVDFTGIFPQFPAGSQQLTYNDSLTTRTADLSVTYQPRLV